MKNRLIFPIYIHYNLEKQGSENGMNENFSAILRKHEREDTKASASEDVKRITSYCFYSCWKKHFF